jgi:beta-xylosidase
LPGNDFEFSISGRGDNRMGCATVHQGGIVDLPNGERWGVAMRDFRSVGRTVCLAPITWKEGWPYFGLEGNLGQTPRTWLKPAVGGDVPREAPYRRSGFTTDGKRLNPVWQWNHEPVDGKWKLAQGTLVLKTMAAKDFLWARNTLTQRCIGPVSEATVTLDVRGLRDGDAAGLGLLNIPYAWIGVERDGRTAQLVLRDQLRHVHRVVDGRVGHKVWLRITGDFDNDRASMAYSHDGEHFVVVTDSIAMPYQLKTFQGSRYSLFAFNSRGKAGGTARFSDYRVVEPMADRTGNLPVGKVITLTNWPMGRGWLPRHMA